MKLLNFSHPITPAQKMDIERAVFSVKAEIEEIKVSIDMDASLMLQVAQLLPRLSPGESILVRLPGHPEAAALLLQLLLDKVSLVSLVCFKSEKTPVGINYKFKEIIVLTGNEEMK